MEPTSDEALLTAYLDSELSSQERQSLEQRLADEPELRQRLNLLEETWHYLDLLEKEDTDPEKIETTLKILAVSMSAPVLPLFKSTSLKTSRWGGRVFLFFVGLFFFALFFLHTKHSPYDDPSFRRMVERHDMYLIIVNDESGLELLQQLALHRIFLPPLLGGAVDNVPIEEYKPSLRIRWSSTLNSSIGSFHKYFDDRGSDQLFYRSIQTYRLLSPRRMEQIQQLHQAIESAPRHSELMLTLHNYYHWLKSLQSYERTALQQPKPLEDRVADIIELKTRLDRLLPEEAVIMSSEIVGMEESKRLADTLSDLLPIDQERLLDDEPVLILDQLKQLSYH